VKEMNKLFAKRLCVLLLALGFATAYLMVLYGRKNAKKQVDL